MTFSALNLVPRPRCCASCAGDSHARAHAGQLPSVLVTQAQVTAQLAQVTGEMAAANQAVQNNSAALATTDVTQWNGIYQAWLVWAAGLSDCLGDSYPSLHADCLSTYGYVPGTPPNWGAASQKLGAVGAPSGSYSATASVWQAKVAQAVPGYTPPPSGPSPGVNPPGSPSGGGDWATAVTWIGIAIVVVVIGVEVWPVFAPAIALAVSKI